MVLFKKAQNVPPQSRSETTISDASKYPTSYLDGPAGTLSCVYVQVQWDEEKIWARSIWPGGKVKELLLLLG